MLCAALVGCSTTTTSPSPNLIGTHDLVFVDQLGEGGAVAKLEPVAAADGGVAWASTGMPSRYVYVTSADTNELRVLETFRTQASNRAFLAAPNPIEALSIPVLQRPTMLATEEGRNSLGARVSGQYVFASRPGAEAISVVSVAARRQIGGGPLPTPAPVTAIAASMDVGADQRLPEKSTLFVATWDGAVGAIYSAALETAPAALDAKIREGAVRFERLALVQGAPFAAIHAVAPFARRTVDGAPFCATSWCLAISTRPTATHAGLSLLLDPATQRSVPLSFPGPVRKLATGAITYRLYGVLEEAGCSTGSADCGGIVAVDLVSATSSAGFPQAKNVVGAPFGPLRVNGSIINGLSIAQGASVNVTTEADGGLTIGSFLVQSYDELGAFSSSDGYITFFSGFAGSIIDFDARRTMVTAASVRTPGALPDGGSSFVDVDGGMLGSLVAQTVTQTTEDYASQVNRTASVTPAPNQEWKLDLSDGYLVTQDLVVSSRAPIPGLVARATTATDGTRLTTGGFEGRAQPGDTVWFETGDDTSAYVVCGTATVTGINAGSVDVDAVPAGCEARSRFTIRSAGAQRLLVVAGNEGYLGRAAPGDVFSWSRPLVMIPSGVIADRPALTLEIPTEFTSREVLPGDGAYITFGIQGHMTPLRVAVDTTTTGTTTSACNSSVLNGQVVFGNLSVSLVPRNVNAQSNVSYEWVAFSVVPSANALAEINLSYTRVGTFLSTTDRAYCYR